MKHARAPRRLLALVAAAAALYLSAEASAAPGNLARLPGAELLGLGPGTLVSVVFGLCLVAAAAGLVIVLRQAGKASLQRGEERERVRGELAALEEKMLLLAAAEPVDWTVLEARDGALAGVGKAARGVQERLQRMEQDLERSEQAKGDFLGNMSHEIRTPMNGIIGTLNLLHDTGLSEEQRGLVEVMRGSSFGLMHLINDILDFSKLVSRSVALEKQPILVRDLIDETMELFAYTAAEKGLELCHYVDDSAPATIFADRRRLQQVMTNLIGNAVKFTCEGEVFASFTGREVITETGSRELILHCSVRDTGVGIPPDNLESIFEAFTQVDESTTRKHGGTGMGLAISRELCRLMGGDIGVESEVWKGSHFFFELPFGGFAEKDPQTIDARTRWRKILGGKKAVVLCRQPTLASLIDHLCVRHGIEAVIAPELTPHQMDEVIAMAPGMVIVEPRGQSQAQMGRFCAMLNRHGIPWLGLLQATDRRPEDAAFAGFKVDFCFKPLAESAIMESLCKLVGGDEGYDGEQDSRSLESARSFARKHPARVMVVDDVDMNRKICAKILQSLGYAEIATACNGQEALEAVKEHKPDVIFMDLQMPVMGGMEAAEAIRANRSLARQPVIIAITGHALSGVKESCLKAGMDDFMTKPVEVGVLKDVVSRNYGKLVHAA